MNNEIESYNKDVVEFVTVAVQFCNFVENANQMEKNDFLDKMLKILPLVYLKVQMMPEYENIQDIQTEQFVEEDNYNIVRTNVACLLGHYDDFLDVFVEDMKYSDTPILCTVSELIADIYQDVKNFVMNFKVAAHDNIIFEAVAQCKQDFAFYWGQKLVNVMRPLHEIKYQMDKYEEDDV